MATATFYPDVDPETTSVSGRSANQDSSTTWATVHDATDGSTANTSLNAFALTGKNSTAKFDISRVFILFDTSSLPNDAIISSAVISMYVVSVAYNDNDTQAYAAIYSSTPASNTDITTADYDQIGSTVLSDKIDLDTITIDQYQAFTLNATGISAISLTGVSKFSIREGHDAENVAYAGANNTSNYMGSKSANSASSDAEKPKLVVTYTVPASPSNFFLVF
jgi:hypothetical protein